MKMNLIKVILIAIAFSTANITGYAQHRGSSINGKNQPNFEHRAPAKPGNGHVAPNHHFTKPAPKPMPPTAMHNHGHVGPKPAPHHYHGLKPAPHHHYAPAPVHVNHHFTVAYKPAPKYYSGMVVRELPCNSYTTYIHNGERYYNSMGVLFKAILINGLVHLLVI